jgi:hypothetical protein
MENRRGSGVPALSSALLAPTKLGGNRRARVQHELRDAEFVELLL